MKFFLRNIIELWVRLTGRPVPGDLKSWLQGPYAEQNFIGSDYYKFFAASAQLRTLNDSTTGLIKDFRSTISEQDPYKNKLQDAIAHFYEHTASYKLEVWSEWYRPGKYFAQLLIRSLSGSMDQLNIPLRPLETSRGMSNEVIAMYDDKGEQQYACWLRKTIASQKVVYAGFYSRVLIKGQPFVKVVFPLPRGSATVVLEVVVQDDGSVRLISGNKRPGGAGYYRMHYSKSGKIHYKFVPLKEIIHVYTDEEGVLRTDHIFRFLGMKLLHLHYKMTIKNSSSRIAGAVS